MDFYLKNQGRDLEVPPPDLNQDPKTTNGVNEDITSYFIVSEAYTVVHPGAVMVHLESANLTHGAVVGSIRFYTFTFLTVSNCTLNTPLLNVAPHV